MFLRQAILRASPGATGAILVVAKSQGVDADLESRLRTWTPGCGELNPGQSHSLNFFPLGPITFGVSRVTQGPLATYGSPVRHLYHHVILLELDQLHQMHNNIVPLLNRLESNGDWILSPGPRRRNRTGSNFARPENNGTSNSPTGTGWQSDLPHLEIKQPPFNYAKPQVELSSRMSAELQRAVRVHQQVVVTDLPNPIRFLASFVNQIPVDQRLKYSFSTGLRFCDERPFTLHFFPQSNLAVEMDVVSRQLRTMSFARLASV